MNHSGFGEAAAGAGPGVSGDRITAVIAGSHDAHRSTGEVDFRGGGGFAKRISWTRNCQFRCNE